jgi:hypothetical protein
MTNNNYKRKKFIKRNFSKETLKTFTWNPEFATVTPNFSFQAVLELIENDTVARGALNHFVDKCMEGDYSIVKRADRKYDRNAELILEEKYMFRTKVLRKIFLLGKLFNNVFIEVVRETDGKTKSINILDSTNVDPITESNGDPIKYKSKLADPETGEYAEWSKKDITWVKFGDRTVGYAPVDMRALWDNLLLKSYVLRYVTWLWKTGQYRLMYNFENASNSDIESFLAMARRNDDKFEIPFVAKGKLTTSLLRDMREIGSLIDMLKYLDSQTLILMRIPPIDAGIPDASGRSNADAQSNNIESTVTSWKKVVADYINYDLFTKINKATSTLVWGPMNRFAVKQLLEMAKTMKDLNMTDEAMTEFMNDNGMFFEAKMFNEPQLSPIEESMNGGFKKKDFGEGNEPQDEVTTREDQLKKV